MSNHVFEFSSRKIDMVIAGHQLSLVYSTELGDKMRGFQARLMVLAKEIAEKEKTDDDAKALCAELIDGIFEEGAFEKIFSGRKFEIADVTDLILFLKDEVENAKKGTGNRAQRREKKK